MYFIFVSTEHVGVHANIVCQEYALTDYLVRMMYAGR